MMEARSEEGVVISIGGIDRRFTSEELTLSLDELRERVLKPAMEELAAKLRRMSRRERRRYIALMRRRR